MKIPWWHTEFGAPERERLLQAFDQRHLSLGPETQELEKSFQEKLRVPYVVVTNSGTSALMMSLMALELQPGDEVIVPDVTWIATAQAASLQGIKVVIADTQPDLPLFDLEDVKRKITPQTKAIIPVHMNGRSVDMVGLLKIAKDHGVAIVEDACKALFSQTNGKYLGTLGDLGCFSLGMISIVPACYGGVVVTHRKDLFEKLKIIRWHGVTNEGNEEYSLPGSNFKYSDLLAAMGLAQLGRLDEKIKKLNSLYRLYETGLKDFSFIRMIPVDLAAGQIPLLIDVRSPYRQQIVEALRTAGIETCNFHPPLHEAGYLRNQGAFPNATQLAGEAFHLPSGPGQSFENVDRCLEALSNLRNTWK